MSGGSPWKLVTAGDPEAAIRRQHAAAIEAARALGPVDRWRPGRPLRLLLAGYVGAFNTGADVRSAELARQLRALLGTDEVELGVLAMQPQVPEQLGEVTVEVMDSQLAPARFVSETCDRYDGVIACEGSLFTSTFSNDLTVLLSAFMGYAAAQGKLAVAAGAEADAMTSEVALFVQEQCRDVVVFARNGASRLRLAELGLQARAGADTAWTFVPKPAKPAGELLRELGWDGESDVLAICPGNPFWWPVELDPRRALRMRDKGDPNYYGNYTFHRSSKEIEARLSAYLDALAAAVTRHGRRYPVFPVVIGMERLDRAACESLAERLQTPPPMIAGDHGADTIVSVLRTAAGLISTRLHAIILSMSAGVPAIGIAFDGRIRALLGDVGLPEHVLDSHDEMLEERLVELLGRVALDRDRISHVLRGAAAEQLSAQGEMGRRIREEIVRRFPQLSLRPLPVGWRGGLPELEPELETLVAGS
ncbi:MAG: polysaccharide pyruvyl transferase family protein [Solirubrobacteraceae bacterium]